MRLNPKFGLAALMMLSACQKAETSDSDIISLRQGVTYQTAIGCTAASSVLITTTPSNENTEITIELAKEINSNAQGDAFAKRNTNQTIVDVGREIYEQSIGMQMVHDENSFERIWSLVTETCRPVYASAATNKKFDSMSPK